VRVARLSRGVRAAALVLLAFASAPAAAQSDTSAFRSETPGGAVTIADEVAEASRRFGVPERWIWAVMRVESNGNPAAVSSAGAMGLMQIMPDTWTYLRARYRLGNDPFDRRDNILGGTAYLREMHDRFGAPGFLAAYNAGPGRYVEYLARGRPLPSETRTYLARLAPAVGASTAERPAAAAPTDPNAWTRAALFPERPDGNPADDGLAAETPANAQPASREDHPAERRETIFVALRGQPPR
jgi:soluble lytic murein transglycosylase-like protein